MIAHEICNKNVKKEKEKKVVLFTIILISQVSFHSFPLSEFSFDTSIRKIITGITF